MRLHGAYALVLIWSILLPAGDSSAQTHGAALPPGEVGIDEKLGDFVPLDLGFVGADSDSVYLRDVIDKPTVLTLVYYHCPQICLPLLNGVADVVSRTDLKPGQGLRYPDGLLRPVRQPRDGGPDPEQRHRTVQGLAPRGGLAVPHGGQRCDRRAHRGHRVQGQTRRKRFCARDRAHRIIPERQNRPLPLRSELPAL